MAAMNDASSGGASGTASIPSRHALLSMSISCVDAVRFHQGRIGIGDDVAEHGGRADQLRDAVVFQDWLAVCGPGGQRGIDVGLSGQAIRLLVEVEVPVEVRLQIALASDSLREFGVVRGHHNLRLTNTS